MSSSVVIGNGDTSGNLLAFLTLRVYSCFTESKARSFTHIIMSYKPIVPEGNLP